MNKSPLVSVIVPCYNQDAFLEEALQSVLDQTYVHWECIIVNDGSIDNTEIIALDWCTKDSRFKYLYKENGGLSSARNYGIKNAIGEYILTLDSDDKYEFTFIEKALKVIANNDNVGVVSSWLYKFPFKKEIELHKPIGGNIKNFLFSNSSIGTSLFRKECWEKVGGYDENMKLGYEDWEFYIRVCKLGFIVHIIQEPLFYYRQHDVSMRTVAVKNYNNVIRKYIIFKHENLYKDNFKATISHLLNRIEREEKEKIKNTQRIEYRLGYAILKPFRFIKSLIK